MEPGGGPDLIRWLLAWSFSIVKQIPQQRLDRSISYVPGNPKRLVA